MCAMSTKKSASTAFDALEVDDARIGAGARNDHLRFVLVRELFDFVVVDAFVFFAHTIRDEFVHAPGKIQRVAMCQVAAMGEIHTQHGVAGLQRGHVDRDVGGGAGMRLYIGVLGSEELFRAVNGELFDFIGDLATSVIALARVALGVFVGEDRAHGFEHGFRD